MGLLPLTHFDDPPQLTLQVVLPGLMRIMCLRLSRTHTGAHTDTIWMEGGSLGNPLQEGKTAFTE